MNEKGMEKKMVEAFVFAVAGMLSTGALADGDWLLDPEPYEAKVTISDDRVVLENGLVSRTITLKPAPATISIRNLTTGDEHLRAISPEARVTINGKGCDVGGLLGQPILNYLKTEWLADMRPYTNFYAYVKSEQGPIEARFPCKLRREWMSRDLPWPPKGRHLMMHYAPQRPGLPDVTVHYEIYDGLPLFSKWLTVENRSGRACTLTTFVTDEIRFMEYSDVLFPFAGDIRENFTPIAEDVCGGGERIGYRFCKEPDYKTQRPYFYEGVSTLKFTPGCNVDVTLPDKGSVECFRSWLLFHDSADRERRSLAIRRTYRTIAPWTDENPLLFHLMQKATPESVREGVRQCAETGFEAMIISFGTGFNLESTDRAYRASYRAIADEARAKGVVIGGYSLTSSRNAGTLADNVKGKCLFDRGPCLGSAWGRQYVENLKSFMDEAGFGVFENDGPYPGDFCSATNHPGHTTAGNSYWAQWHAQADLYHFCRSRGIYVNQPDWYFLIGGNKTGMGYRESNWTLPREYQKIIERQNIYNGTWNKSTSMGWMFIPLSSYHNGGKGSIVEPLRENLAHYDHRFADTFGAGVQSLLRGPRLFDSPETLAVVRKWVKFFKDHRRVLTGDFIHLRRADGRDWDGWVLVDSQAEEKALAFLFNPTDREMTRKIALPLYYAGLMGSATISVNGGVPAKVPLDAACRASVTVTIPANGYVWLLVQSGACAAADDGVASSANGVRTAYRQPGQCVWCPSPAALPTGGVALVHSRWPEKHRFGAWLTDSEIALATAATADGPFVPRGVILKGSGRPSDWDRDAVHNPYVLRHGDKWLLYYMGTHGEEPHPRSRTPGWWIYRNNQRIGLAVADRIEGPWKRLGQLDVMPPEGVLCSNPAVCETKDGRFLMVFKWVENRRPAPAYGPVHLGSAIADSPYGPFRLVAKDVFPVAGVDFPGEDPCLWREEGRLCCLIHDMGKNYSAHSRALIRFESEDGISWTKKGVAFKKGTVNRLERPFLLVRNDAKPVLFAAAKDDSRTDRTRIVGCMTKK